MNPYSKLLIVFTFLVRFAATANAQIQSLTTKELEIRVVNQFDAVYADNGTDADQDLSTWRPRVSSGFMLSVIMSPKSV